MNKIDWRHFLYGAAVAAGLFGVVHLALGHLTGAYIYFSVALVEICIASYLRAKAPALLEAAKQVLADHKERIELYPGMNNQPNRVMVMEQLETAITNIEGE